MKRRYFPLPTNSCRSGSLFVNCWIPPVVKKTEGYGKSSTTPQKDGGTAVPSHKRRRRVGVNLLAWSWGCPSFSFLRGVAVAFSRLQKANPNPKKEGQPEGPHPKPRGNEQEEGNGSTTHKEEEEGRHPEGGRRTKIWSHSRKSPKHSTPGIKLPMRDAKSTLKDGLCCFSFPLLHFFRNNWKVRWLRIRGLLLNVNDTSYVSFFHMYQTNCWSTDSSMMASPRLARRMSSGLPFLRLRAESSTDGWQASPWETPTFQDLVLLLLLLWRCAACGTAGTSSRKKSPEKNSTTSAHKCWRSHQRRRPCIWRIRSKQRKTSSVRHPCQPNGPETTTWGLQARDPRKIT